MAGAASSVSQTAPWPLPLPSAPCRPARWLPRAPRTAMVRPVAGEPSVSASQSAKAAPMKNTMEGVSVTASPGITASMAQGGGEALVCRAAQHRLSQPPALPLV